MKPHRPYVGVTGFTRREQVFEVHTSINPDLWKNRDLMVGVLASTTTLNGETNTFPNQYAPREDWEGIFRWGFPHQCRLMHYNIDDPTNLIPELTAASDFCGYWNDGFQINVPWPSAEDLFRYRQNHAKIAFHTEDHFHDVRMILQIGAQALEECKLDPGNPEAQPDPDVLARRVQRYCLHNAISDILLDPSGGLGKPFDPELSLKLLYRIRVYNPHLGVGIAGGLCAETLALLLPFRNTLTDVSTDAQKRLRDKNDDLSIPHTVEYVRGTLCLFA